MIPAFSITHMTRCSINMSIAEKNQKVQRAQNVPSQDKRVFFCYTKIGILCLIMFIRNGRMNVENKSVYRQSSLDRIQSPEQLNSYLRVTNPSAWIVLIAVIVLLVGALVWGSFTYIGSFVDGNAHVENGVMTIVFEDDDLARNVQPGMNVTIGEANATVTSVGRGDDGRLFALADTTLANGSYPVKVSYRQTQIMQLLFN